MIHVSDVTRLYNLAGRQVIALNRVSLNIKKGELVAIVGKSGSGKSSLMNILGCLDRPTSGRYTLLGKDVGKLSLDQLSRLRREEIGFIFQGFHLLGKMSALENVALPLMCARIPRAERIQRAEEALYKVGLGDRLSHRPSQMSGGQQQRVAIARALIGKPQLILADEPTGNLDTKSGEDILSLLLEANRLGHTVVLITHDEKVARCARRVIMISNGEITSDIVQ